MPDDERHTTVILLKTVAGILDTLTRLLDYDDKDEARLKLRETKHRMLEDLYGHDRPR